MLTLVLGEVLTMLTPGFSQVLTKHVLTPDLALSTRLFRLKCPYFRADSRALIGTSFKPNFLRLRRASWYQMLTLC